MCIHAKMKVRVHLLNEDGNRIDQVIETDPRPHAAVENVPRTKVPFIGHQPLLNKKEHHRAHRTVYRQCGTKQTVIVADRSDGAWVSGSPARAGNSSAMTT